MTTRPHNMYIVFRRGIVEHGGFLIACMIVAILFLIPRYLQYISFGSPNLFGMGASPPDFFQYVTLVKTGMNGSILFKNVFDPFNTYPPMILQPFYHLFGFVGRIFTTSPYHVYSIALVTCLFGFMFALYSVTKRVFPTTPVFRLLALLFFIFNTSMWEYGWDGGLLTFNYTNYLRIYTKFNSLPPHHFAASILFIILILSFLQTRQGPRSFIVTIALAVVFGFVHPPNAMVAIPIVLLYIVLISLRKRKVQKNLLIHWLLYTTIIIPILLYHRHLVIDIFQSDLAKNEMFVWVKRGFTTIELSKGLGPLTLLIFPAFFFRKNYNSNLFVMIVAWIAAPLIMIYASDLHIPYSVNRLFQIHLHIPIAILAALSVKHIAEKTRISTYILMALVLTPLIVYAVPSYHLRLYDEFRRYSIPYHSVAYAQLQPVLKYLNNNTPQDSMVYAHVDANVVILPERHNRVVLAHNGTVPLFLDKFYSIQTFYEGRASQKELYQLFTAWNVEYILFGGLVPNYETFPFAAYPFLEEVYRFRHQSVVRFDPEKYAPSL